MFHELLIHNIAPNDHKPHTHIKLVKSLPYDAEIEDLSLRHNKSVHPKKGFQVQTPLKFRNFPPCSDIIS